MKRSRMDIQSNDDYVMLDSNTYFKNYLSYKNWNLNENFTKKVLNEYTNELYININNYLRRVKFSYKVTYNIKPELKRINSTEYSYTIQVTPVDLKDRNSFFTLHKIIKSLSNSLTGLGPYIPELDDIPKYTTVYRGVKKSHLLGK